MPPINHRGGVGERSAAGTLKLQAAYSKLDHDQPDFTTLF